MKKLCLTLILLTFASSSALADEQTPEQLANSILQDRIASSIRVGFAKPDDDVILMELDVNLYQAALDSDDDKIKALVAIQALKSMTHFVREGEKPLSDKQKEKAFSENLQYKKLKTWYLEIINN